MAVQLSNLWLRVRSIFKRAGTEPQHRSLQDITRARKNFVGRATHLKAFIENLSLSPDDPSKLFVFNFYGQGGIGKTTLMRRLQDQARAKSALTAWIDEDIPDIPTAMAKV